MRAPSKQTAANFLKALVLLCSWMCFTFSKKSASGSLWVRIVMSENLVWEGKIRTNWARREMDSCLANCVCMCACVYVCVCVWKGGGGGSNSKPLV